MATPSLTQAPTTYNYVNSLDLTLSPHEPQVDGTLTPRYGNQNITGFMEMQGSMNPVAAIQYNHFEEDWIQDIIEVVGQAAGAANAAVTFTIATSYQYVYPGSGGTTAQAPYIVGSESGIPVSGGTTIPVRLKDVLLFPDGTEALVTATTPGSGTFVCYPIITGQNIPATTTNVTQIIISGNAHEEQSDQPASRNTTLIRYTNNLQIFKGNSTASGTEMGVKTWFQVPDENGKMGWLWYFKAQRDEKNRFENDREIQMVTGQKISNATLAALVPTTTKTEGLIPFIVNYGNVATYSAVSGIQLADFESAIVTLDKNRGSKENTVWCGINLSQGIDRFMRDTMKNGGISYGAFGGDATKAISFNFDSFVLTNYTFHKKTYDLFNHPRLLGAAGFPYQNMGLIIPADKVAATFEPGSKAKVTVPSLRMNYLKGDGNGYSRLLEEWVVAGADGVYNQTVDQWSYNLRSHAGFEGFAANRYMQLKAV